jgi:hypothetical protein
MGCGPGTFLWVPPEQHPLPSVAHDVCPDEPHPAPSTSWQQPPQQPPHPVTHDTASHEPHLAPHYFLAEGQHHHAHHIDSRWMVCPASGFLRVTGALQTSFYFLAEAPTACSSSSRVTTGSSITVPRGVLAAFAATAAAAASSNFEGVLGRSGIDSGSGSGCGAALGADTDATGAALRARKQLGCGRSSRTRQGQILRSWTHANLGWWH